MKIIAIANEKGGVGKSTVTQNLGTGLQRKGFTVVIADADLQGTCVRWRARRPDGFEHHLPEVSSAHRPGDLEPLRRLQVDYLIIDTPGRADSARETDPRHVAMIIKAIGLADSVLIPLQPCREDMEASAPVVQAIHRKRDLGSEVQAAFVLSHFHSTKLSRQIRDGQWPEQYGLPLLTNSLGRREAYRQALSDGVSVYDLPRQQEAWGEVDLLIDELTEMELL